MRVVASLVTLWAVLRWLGLIAGLIRMRKLDGPVRREARRSAIGHLSLDVFLSVAALYSWAFALQLQPVGRFVSAMAAVMMISLCAAVVAWFMQPEERSPEVWALFRLRPTSRPPPRSPDA